MNTQRLSLSKIFLFESKYVFPFIGFPVFLWLWVRDGSPAFAALVMGLPLIFGYVIPGIGTNVLKLWRFNGPWLMADIFSIMALSTLPPLAWNCIWAFSRLRRATKPGR